MLFHTRSNHICENFSVVLNNVPVVKVASFELLGFTLDSDLSLDLLTNNLITKLNKCCIVLQRARRFCGKKILNLLFDSIGLSYIIYYSLLTVIALALRI